MATSFYKWLVLPLFSLLWMDNHHFMSSGALKLPTAHPIHISTLEVAHNATDKTLEITCKIFWDDFETILTRKNNNQRVDLTNAKNVDANNKLVAAYLSSHLNITIDGKPLTLNFIGFEKEDIVVYSYLEVTNINNIKNVSINNNLMHDMFDDQTNIVHVIFNGNRKSTKLDYPSTAFKIEF